MNAPTAAQAPTAIAGQPRAYPFNRPFVTGREHAYIAEALAAGHLSGDGPFTVKCHAHLEALTGTHKALITHSCTAALEMAALILDLQPGDEVIVPSYTFVSSASAFVLRGAVPVFVDVRSDTLNLDEGLIEQAITGRTRAIVPVHYAGVGCEMDGIMAIAAAHNLAVVEDAAQAICATYKGKPLGSIGTFGAFSFHETKNIISGEGGALLINEPAYALDAEIIREKGTNRAQFFRGQVDKYTWRRAGSSYLPSEIIAATLLAQLEDAEAITARRLEVWNGYHARMEGLEARGLLSRPSIPAHCTHNAHMYQMLLAPGIDRAAFIAGLKESGIHATFHYVPLHSAPAGEKYGRCGSAMTVTDDIWQRLVRLPMGPQLALDDLDYISGRITALLG